MFQPTESSSGSTAMPSRMRRNLVVSFMIDSGQRLNFMPDYVYLYAPVPGAALGRIIGLYGLELAVAYRGQLLRGHAFLDEELQHRESPGRRKLPIGPEADGAAQRAVVRMALYLYRVGQVHENGGKAVQVGEGSGLQHVAAGLEKYGVGKIYAYLVGRDLDLGYLLDAVLGKESAYYGLVLAEGLLYGFLAELRVYFLGAVKSEQDHEEDHEVAHHVAVGDGPQGAAVEFVLQFVFAFVVAHRLSFAGDAVPDAFHRLVAAQVHLYEVRGLAGHY